tara:strand:+ start:1498 stop:2217 length:720 start_codon:yes stop_codon:yes gene_type:complete
MRLLLFTKDMGIYRRFISLCNILFDDTLIVFSEDHPRKKDKEYSLFLKKCQDYNPDIIISFYYNKIVQREIINLSSIISVNFHGSILPNYAGSHTINWQIINGEKESGVTIHTLTNKVDAGNIVMQEKFSIENTDTALDVLLSGIDCSCDMLEIFYNQIKNGEIFLSKQILQGGEFVCKKRVPADSMISSDMSPEQVCNLVRALIPMWPKAFYLDSKNRKVFVENVISKEEAKKILEKI